MTKFQAHSRVAEIFSVVLFVTIMAAANLLIGVFGAGFLPVTAFVGVGVSLVSRDYLHDIWSERAGAFWPRMLTMIAAAALLSYFVDQSVGLIAVASVCALISSALTETFVFTLIAKRSWMFRSPVSSVFGAFADSFVFPLIAFGYFGVTAYGLTGVLAFWVLVLTQMATKSAGAFIWAWAFKLTIDPDSKRIARQERREILKAKEVA